jgi:voltage-gated potassium channel
MSKPPMMQRFVSRPSSVRTATVAVVSVTVAVVFAGAVIVRLFDSSEYPTFGKAVWFTLQTITTVGYGDATPERAVGRIVAGVVMVTAIGLITVITAAITSVFVEAARSRFAHEAREDDETSVTRLEESLHAIDDRLDRLERLLVERHAEDRSVLDVAEPVADDE